MACGLPGRGNRWKELDNIDSPAYLADGSRDFSVKLEQAIKIKNPGRFIDFAKKNSWMDRFEILREKVLSKKLVEI